MKFLVTRTSDWLGKPCEEAYKAEYARLDIRRFKTPEEYNRKFKDKWEERGNNHRINERGLIQREFTDNDWFIDINTLDELLKFKDKYGSIVIEDSFENKSITSLEIYDSHRE